MTTKTSTVATEQSISSPSAIAPDRRVDALPESRLDSLYHVKNYAMAIADQLKTPGLLGDCRQSIDLLRSSAAADVETLERILQSDNVFYRDMIQCISTIQTDVPGRTLETERVTLLAALLKDLPGIKKESLSHSSREEIAFVLRQAILIVASRPHLVCEQLVTRELIGLRQKLNDTGTVQRFTDFQLRVKDEILASQTSRCNLRTEVREWRYLKITETTDRVTRRFDLRTTETQIITRRVLAGAQELDINASVAFPERIAELVSHCLSPWSQHLRLVVGGLCNYQQTEEVLRCFDHDVEQQWIEQANSREVVYRQIVQDAAIASGVVAAVVSLPAIVARASASMAASSMTAASTTMEDILSHIDPAICWGPFVITGFLPPGYDLSVFE